MNKIDNFSKKGGLKAFACGLVRYAKEAKNSEFAKYAAGIAIGSAELYSGLCLTMADSSTSIAAHAVGIALVADGLCRDVMWASSTEDRNTGIVGAVKAVPSLISKIKAKGRE